MGRLKGVWSSLVSCWPTDLIRKVRDFANDVCVVQEEGRQMEQRPSYTAVSVSPAPRQYVSPKSWLVKTSPSHEHSKSPSATQQSSPPPPPKYTSNAFDSCFVRARRLNVIIQPHLRFVYELMKFDEVLQQRRGEGIKRELEWASVAREIACMNRPYARG
jgi:hypothetical protein